MAHIQNFISAKQKTEALVLLGKFLKQFAQKPFVLDSSLPNWEEQGAIFKNMLQLAYEQNGWFTEDNLCSACHSWAEALEENNIEKWLSGYDFSVTESKTVAIIMAGNVPLVGLHDFLSVLVSNHKAVVKLSSNDKVLLPFLADYLAMIAPFWQRKYAFSSDPITHFDAVIATGSNNTARYFEYYFGKKPHIIRRNRHSVAVLSGKETQEDLQKLGKDIFCYFGLGCRSVSKLFVPRNYDFNLFFKAIFPYKDIVNHIKYANNYDYNKAVYLMSLFQLRENGFLILKEDESFASPIATLFYEFYDDIHSLKEKITVNSEKIQCIVSQGFVDSEIAFGETQKPQLWDYADGVDTLSFLCKL